MSKFLLRILCCVLIINGAAFFSYVSAQSVPNGDFSAEWETGYNGVGKQHSFPTRRSSDLPIPNKPTNWLVNCTEPSELRVTNSFFTPI